MEVKSFYLGAGEISRMIDKNMGIEFLDFFCQVLFQKERTLQFQFEKKKKRKKRYVCGTIHVNRSQTVLLNFANSISTPLSNSQFALRYSDLYNNLYVFAIIEIQYFSFTYGRSFDYQFNINEISTSNKRSTHIALRVSGISRLLGNPSDAS